MASRWSDFAFSTVCSGGSQIGPDCQRDAAEFFERHDVLSEIEGAGNVELFNRRAVVQQRQQLDFRRADIYRGCLDIGQILHALQIEPHQIHLRDIAGFVAGRC